MKLDEVYTSVKEDLNSVKNRLKALAESERASFPELNQMLASILPGGKVIRPALTLLSGKLFSPNLDILLKMAVAVELLHIATLVHDDAIDKSLVRRHKPTIYKLWGEEKAVLSGDFLFAKSGELAASTGSIRVVTLFAQTLQTISRGELKQSFGAFNLNQSRDDYIYRVSCKTASLFSLATQSGAILNQAKEPQIKALDEYARNLGIAFQIVDDVLDFIGSEREMGKPVGSDLTQGTLTLPAMLLLERYPEDNPVKRLFQDSSRKEEIKLAIELVQNSSIPQECYGIATDYLHKACRSLDLLPDNASRRALTTLADFVVNRRK